MLTKTQKLRKITVKYCEKQIKEVCREQRVQTTDYGSKIQVTLRIRDIAAKKRLESYWRH